MFDRNIKVRIGITLMVLLIAFFYLAPTLTDHIPSFWKDNLPSDKIHLGLDLQGGMHLILEVQAEKAVESSVERIANSLKETLMEKRIRIKNLDRIDGTTITLELPNSEASDRFRTVLNDEFPTLTESSSKITEGRETVHLTLQADQVASIKKFALEQSLETIRNRVDQFGVSEPEIVPQAHGRILVQLPGVKDPQRAINLIGKTALLEFKLVDDEHKDLVKMAKKYTEDAKVAIGNRFNEPYVAIKFDSQGARDFDRITADNVKKRLAIVLDGVVHSAPVIQERISGGDAQITGSFTMNEARDLAIVLRAGALPAPVSILEQRTVGPSLGHDSINKGFWSIITGMIIVLIFMVIYYHYSGFIADMALVLNIILILGALAAFRATLTLPGIAGIVLTIGMAVDANVLIFERIREELRLGKSPRAAVSAGYGKALITIIDANITTLIAAVVLFQFGTGPVKGFAVTLCVGIVCSMFTAIFVTRIVYDYFIWHKKIKLVRI